MNLKSIYETLTALGTGALIVGCGAQQTPVDTAEAPSAETAPTSEMKEANAKEADAPIATSNVASPEEKPTATTTAAASPSPTPAGATPAAAATAPVAATAKPVAKKATATGKTTGKKKDAGSACGEGGCG